MKEPVSHPSFPEEEKAILKYWQENDIEKQYIEKNSASEKKFKFLDGPITANNPMGVHHAHGRTIKDFFQRYYTMKGYKQRYQNGFDCQGLWVEVEEEKDLGFNSKADIERFGIDNFCTSCRARVDRFSVVQAQQSQRLGMFMDWKNSYYTMSETNNLHIWHFLKKVHEKGWLYKGIDAMPWCTRCGTAISQHELSDGGYKDVTHESVYVRFYLTDDSSKKLTDYYKLSDKPISILVWTTTPWTLLANTAIAINPKVEYTLLLTDEEYLLIADNRKSIVSEKANILEHRNVLGQELLELFSEKEELYRHPFEQLDRSSKQSKKVLISWDDVTDSEGTGFVHIAPSAGKEDFELGKMNKLGFDEPTIDEFGVYVDGFGDFTGKDVFHVKNEIFDALKETGKYYAKEEIFHAYPHCWRCKSELVFRTTEEWFIDVEEIRPQMKKAAGEVNWLPQHSGKRMQDWLDNMGPWPISRKRYWGLALPFYVNEDGNKWYVVGSKEELRDLAIKPELVDQLKELHRPWIDEIELDGSKIVIDGQNQMGVWRRVKDVGDCWLDAGIVPFSTVNYLSDPQNWKEWYPFDFITEYVAQIKLWFYATLFMSVTLEGRAPWNNVLATGFLVDEQGKHMHKSAGNAIDFNEAAEQAGADSIRWLYLRERSANHYGTGNLRFGYNILNDVRRRFFVILWNSYRFVVQNAIMDTWDPANYNPNFVPEHILDRWIVSRLYSLLHKINENVAKYDSTIPAEALEEFIVSDFSQWYIRRSRDRVGPASVSDDKSEYYQTAYTVLFTLAKILAPFTPFIAEQIYLNLKQNDMPESVHLMQWPNEQNELIDVSLEEEMELAREIVEKIHSKRKELSFKVRQPLAQVTVSLPKDSAVSPQTVDIVLDEVNIKNMVFASGSSDVIEVELDVQLTPELVEEGLVRDLIRHMQTMRREAGYQFDREVTVAFSSSNEDFDFIHSFEDDIRKKLIAKDIVYNQLLEGDIESLFDADGKNIKVTLKAV